MTDEQARRTVVLLGAGASRASDYELPTMQGFFAEGLLTADSVDGGGKYSLLWKFLQETYGVDRKGDVSKQLADVNLEEVITHLFNLEHSLLPINRHRKAELQSAREELDAYVYQRLIDEPSAKGNSNRTADKTQTDVEPSPPGMEGSPPPCRAFHCEKHERVFHELALLHDSIISINYDLVADGTLQKMKETRGQTDDARSSRDQFRERSRGLLGFSPNWDLRGIGPCNDEMALGYYLKLHGSLDYLYCPNSSCPQHHTFYENRPTLKRYDLPESSFCKLCGRQLVNAIIPPALGKSMDDFPKINVIWSMAYNKLLEADRWIIWGISLAESDHLFRTLLREAAHEAKRKDTLDVSVINPCEAAASKVESVVCAEVRRHECVEDHLDGK